MKNSNKSRVHGCVAITRVREVQPNSKEKFNLKLKGSSTRKLIT
jgi:hypothetical protein